MHLSILQANSGK